MTSSFEHLNVAGSDGGELTPEEQEQFAMSASAAEKRLNPETEETQAQPSTDGQTQQQQQPKASTEAAQPSQDGAPSISDQEVAMKNEQDANPQDDQDQQYMWDEGYDAGDFARNTAEGVLAVPAGMTDFGVDLINKVPGVNIPKIPDFENDVAQSIRDLGNVLFGTYVATKLVRGGASKISKAAPAIGNVKIPTPGKLPGYIPKTDPVAKFLGRTATAATGGVIADEVVEFNEQDDNLMATLKMNTPGWIANRIPMDWTTIGVTDPDTIRERNRNEGLGIGLFTSGLEGLAKVLKATSGTTRYSRNMDKVFRDAENLVREAEYIAKDSNKSINDVLKETGGRNKELMLEGPSTAEETVKATKASLDELGEAALKNDPQATSRPTKGVHDVFDDMESGVRTVDKGGIFAAFTDVARIRGNVGTLWGRVGSVISEARLKYGQISKGQAPTQQVVQELAKQLSKIGSFDAIFPGGMKSIKMDYSEIKRLNMESTAEAIGEAISDRTMTVEKLAGMFSPFKTEDMLNPLKGTNLSEGIDIGITKLTEEYLGLNRAMTSNAVQQSLAGQASDMAEAYRLAGNNIGAANSVNDQVMERLLYVMTERGMMGARAGASLQALKFRKGIPNPLARKKATEDLIKEFSQRELAAFEANKKYVQTLKALQNTKPEFLKPYMLANEMTGGSVNSIYKMNEYMRNNLANLGKALADSNPEMSNQLVQGMWSNIYNSVLSAFSTPIRALVGNAGGLIAKPINTLGGAALSGDMRAVQDGWVAMGAIGDSFSKGWDYMREVFMKVSQDPYVYQDLTRQDFIKTQLRDENLEVLETYAKAAAKDGEMGPSVLLEQAKTLEALATSPFLRFGVNAMTALDGFTKAVVTNGEVRYNAIQKLRAEGAEITFDSVARASKKEFDSLRKADFQDDAISYMTSEIALNAKSPTSTGISKFIAQYPIVRPFFMFPTTSMNMIGMFNKYSPISVFAKDVNDLAFKKLKDFDVETMRDMLTVRKLATKATKDDEVIKKFSRLQAETRGRKAVGTLAIGYGVTSYMNDAITGDGVYNEQVRRVNEDLRVPKRSIKLPTGEYLSYDGLGPVSDWIAMTVTVLENSTMLGETATENFLNKAGYVLSASITEKSVLSQVEPLLGIMNGNGPSAARIAASLANSVIPLAGQRAEWGRLMGEGTKEIEKDFIDYMRNRNKFLTDLPPEHDWLYGDEVNPVAEIGNFFATINNAVSPFKIRAGVRPEAAFLARLEFDARPSITTDGKGNAYPAPIQSQITKLMAENEIFLDAIKAEMAFTERTKFFKNIETARSKNVGSDVVDLSSYENVVPRLKAALERSKAVAINNLDQNSQDLLAAARREQRQREQTNLKGDFINNPEFQNFR